MDDIKLNNTYTIIYTITKNTLTNTQAYYGMYVDGAYGAFYSQTISNGSVDGKIGTFACKITVSTLGSNTKLLSIGVHGGDTNGELVVDDIMLLEGDHTQNPPAYFEGLKSVGEDVDEINKDIIDECFANIKIYDFDENGLFVEMEKAVPAKERDFERLTGYPFDMYCDFLNRCAKNYLL